MWWRVNTTSFSDNPDAHDSFNSILAVSNVIPTAFEIPVLLSFNFHSHLPKRVYLYKFRFFSTASAAPVVVPVVRKFYNFGGCFDSFSKGRGVSRQGFSKLHYGCFTTMIRLFHYFINDVYKFRLQNAPRPMSMHRTCFRGLFLDHTVLRVRVNERHYDMIQ